MTVSSRTDTVKRNRTLLLENNPQFADQPARDQVPFCGFVRRGFRTYMLKNEGAVASGGAVLHLSIHL